MGLGGISIMQFIIILGMFFITLLPCIMALFSKKVAGTDKVVWFLLSFIFSWVGYLSYYFLEVKRKTVRE
jgi:hypothetical protein